MKLPFILALALSFCGAADITCAAGNSRPNLACGLDVLQQKYNSLSAAHTSATEKTAALQTGNGRFVFDATQRLRVEIVLDGTKPLEVVKQSLVGLGCEIKGQLTWYRSGMLTAYLPLDKALNAADVPGVRSIRPSLRPMVRAGIAPAQGAVNIHADAVNAQGFKGAGITIGALSDSYDVNVQAQTHAAEDVTTGDLPGVTNPDGYTTPVNVILDDPVIATATDEGRGMLQIVHDVAPAANLAFATAEGGETVFAANIISLADTGTTGGACNVICDDVIYLDEPMFSDGAVAQAINQVAAQGVCYFSSAGNEGNHGYSAVFTPVSDATVRAGIPGQNIKFTGGPAASLTAGGWHNFNPGAATPDVTQTVTAGSADVPLCFQWDDPFDSGGVTTDYNILIFDAAGNYMALLSGTDDNRSTDEPIEEPTMNLSAGTTYQIAITRAYPTSGKSPATHIRYVALDNGGGFSGQYITPSSIATYGHCTANGASGVAAYIYDSVPNVDAQGHHIAGNNFTPAIEGFSSNGPVDIYFDAAGNRLASADHRLVPAFAAPDGDDTTFFPPPAAGSVAVPPVPILPPIVSPESPNDYEADGFPNFFGTSAAAPHAAAAAALILDASKSQGLPAMTPETVKALLEATAQQPIDADPDSCSAVATANGDTVTVVGNGSTPTDPNTFRVTFAGTGALTKLVINLKAAGLVFDGDATTGYPFTVGSKSGGVGATSSLSADRSTLTINFTAFNAGDFITFGIDRDVAGINAYGNGSDLLQGGVITATVGGQPLTGTFANHFVSGQWGFKAGYGLIDVRAAIGSLLGSRLANISTRLPVGTGQNVGIAGFIVQGNASGANTDKKVLLRAIGPSLKVGNTPVEGRLMDPTLDLYDGTGTLIQSNDNWRSSQQSEIIASGIPPTDNREAAIVTSLPAGSYTGIIRGAGSTTGIGLIEVYDIDPTNTASLANISTRGNVQTGSDVVIGGVIVSGTNPSSALIRGIGPELTAAHIGNALQDPTLELHDANGVLLASNDNWKDTQQAAITATGIAPTDPRESAILKTLAVGNYTAILRGKNNTTGVGLVEVYDLGAPSK